MEVASIYLIYVDESGQATWNKIKEDFVLGSVLVHENKWRFIDNEIIKLKIEIFPNYDPLSWELHASEIMDGRGVFKPLKPDERYEIMNKSYRMIGNLDLNLIGVVLKKTRYRKQVNLEEWAFRFLFERLCKYLEKVNTIGHQDQGLILIDSINRVFDNKRRAHIRKFMEWGTYYSTNKYLIEDPVFVVSQYRHMSQLADMVAYLIRRVQRPKHRKSFDIYFDHLKSKFDTDSQGNIYGSGIKVFPN